METAETAHDRQVLSRRILGLDREVDRLVERMYGLSETEVAQVVRYLAETEPVNDNGTLYGIN